MKLGVQIRSTKFPCLYKTSNHLKILQYHSTQIEQLNHQTQIKMIIVQPHFLPLLSESFCHSRDSLRATRLFEQSEVWKSILSSRLWRGSLVQNVTTRLSKIHGLWPNKPAQSWSIYCNVTDGKFNLEVKDIRRIPQTVSQHFKKKERLSDKLEKNVNGFFHTYKNAFSDYSCLSCTYCIIVTFNLTLDQKGFVQINCFCGRYLCLS